MDERSSPARTAGVCQRTVTLGDQEYLLSQADRVRKRMDEEAVVLALRLNLMPTIAQACIGLPPDQAAVWRDSYIQKFTCGIASWDEMEAFYRSPWELAFRFWHCLDAKHKTIPAVKDPRTGRVLVPESPMTLIEGVRWAYDVVTCRERTVDEIDFLRLAITATSQEELVKNLSGSLEGANQATDTLSTEATQQSSPSS